VQIRNLLEAVAHISELLSPQQKKSLFGISLNISNMAGPTGFEPAISSVTGRRDRPLHYEPLFVTQMTYIKVTGVIIAIRSRKSNSQKIIW